jgi:hypothetical protein
MTMTIERFAPLSLTSWAVRGLSAALSVSLSVSLAVSAVACAGGDDKAPGSASGGATVTGEDLVNTDDLVIEDTGAGATKVGEAAIWLTAGRAQTRQANDYVRAGLAQIKAFAANNEPTVSGTNRAGYPYSIWKGDKDDVSYTLMVARTSENRLRYFLGGRKGAERKTILTGVFLKRGAKEGAGRLHLDLTAMNALTGAPEATGRLHVFFANDGAAKARRIRFREVRPLELGADGAINHGLDSLHQPGVGGVVRAYAIGDLGSKIPELSDLSGVQLAAVRLRWSPTGGRADGALFDFSAQAGDKRLGDFHECWDPGGLRSAYQSFTGKEDEEATTDLVKCGSLAQEDGPATAPAAGVDDADVTGALGDATSIDEADADTALDPDDL